MVGDTADLLRELKCESRDVGGEKDVNAVSHEKFRRGADGDTNYRTYELRKEMRLHDRRDGSSFLFDFSLFHARSTGIACGE